MNGPHPDHLPHAHRLLSERLDRPLGGGERWRLWLHLKLLRDVLAVRAADGVPAERPCDASANDPASPRERAVPVV